MSAINVNSITGRTGSHGPVLTGVTTISSILHVGGGVTVTGISTFNDNVIVKGGNVGIGTTNPGSKLSISGTNEEDVIHISTGNIAGDTFANIRGDNEAGIRIRGGGSFDGGTIELTGGLRDTDPGVIKFSTGTSNSVDEKVRITAHGRVGVNTTTVPAGVNVAVGGTIRVEDTTDATQYLTITHQGIDFQNTGAGSSTTVQNHLLDDYEEGTWTPAYDTNVTSSTAITYNNQTGGSYIKIGRAVYICGRVRTNNNQSLDGTGNIVLRGLPFAISDGFDGDVNTQDTSAVISVQQIDGWNESPLLLLGQAGFSSLDLYNGTTLSEPVVVADFNTGGSGINRMRFSGFYFTDD